MPFPLRLGRRAAAALLALALALPTAAAAAPYRFIEFEPVDPWAAMPASGFPQLPAARVGDEMEAFLRTADHILTSVFWELSLRRAASGDGFELTVNTNGERTTTSHDAATVQAVIDALTAPDDLRATLLAIPTEPWPNPTRYTLFTHWGGDVFDVPDTTGTEAAYAGWDYRVTHWTGREMLGPPSAPILLSQDDLSSIRVIQVEPLVAAAAQAAARIAQAPLPAGVWLLLTGAGVLVGARRLA